MTLTPAQAEAELLARELFGMRFGLERMRRLLLALGSPQRSFGRAVHVVGSNGKSSTTRMLAALAHPDAGAYLSPHLVGFHERVVRGGRDVTPDAFAASVERALRAARAVERAAGDEQERVTQFELLTAAAFDALRDVPVAVVEAGLGGRYDATNTIGAEVAVLTNVALEHTRWLGDTHAAIAREKVDVVAPGGVLVVGAGLHPDALAVAGEVCAARGARLVEAPAEPPVEPLAGGDFQRRNLALAVAAARELGPVDDAALQRAASVLVPGRFERVADDLLLDGAHNAAGMAALADALPRDRRIVACLSILDDKDTPAMLRELLPRVEHVVCTRCANPRALPPATLESLVVQLGGRASVEPDPRRAVARARELAAPDGLAVVAGSLYLLADLRAPEGAARRSTL